MAIDAYPHLPGYRTVLRDGNLKFIPPGPTTQSVLIVGVATDGPVNDPKRLTTIADAEELFGLPTLNAPLLLGWQEAVDAGCEDVRLCRLPGAKATGALVSTDTTPVDLIDVEGKYDGAIYNIELVVAGDTLTVKVPAVKGDADLAYELKTDDSTPVYKTLNALIAEINTDTANNMVTLALAAGATGTDDAELGTGTVTLSGGADAPTNMYTALASAYELLTEYEVDVTAVLGVYADQTPTDKAVGDYAKQLAEHCYKASGQDRLNIGVIAAEPLADTSLSGVATKVAALLALENTYTYQGTDARGATRNVDIGRYISVCFGDGQFRDRSMSKLGSYYGPMAAVYAGLISTLAGQSATTNKVLPGVSNLSFRLSLQQLDNLTAKRFVTFRQRTGRGVSVVDGVTAALTGSDWTRLSTVRIIGDITKALIDASEPYIGEAGGVVQRNALQTTVKTTLDAIQSAGAIQQYLFTVTATPSEMVQGIANIMLEVVPAFELRKIRTVITLRPEL